MHTHTQKVNAQIKIFSEPMPGSNERSIQLVGVVNQLCECVRSFLDDIREVRIELDDKKVNSELIGCVLILVSTGPVH